MEILITMDQVCIPLLCFHVPLLKWLIDGTPRHRLSAQFKTVNVRSEGQLPSLSRPTLVHELAKKDSHVIFDPEMDKQLQEWARDMSQNDKGALANLDLEALYQLRHLNRLPSVVGDITDVSPPKELTKDFVWSIADAWHYRDRPAPTLMTTAASTEEIGSSSGP
ncbi:hypothetical protein NE237_000082 [Protea cynaroides]|uniref:Uncharacterized protein n=1 Tax=Protea cynaroides TaxID=273540 RepID=A0A9Q0GN75_9MAGN|nr:hypothetical protein NE237_000082 [Protea cynaroides]